MPTDVKFVDTPGPSDAPASTTVEPAEACRAVRRQTEWLCEPLQTEDYVVQSMPDVSPTKWHLAHTSWFFETFLLIPHAPGYREFHPSFNYLFNSYYVSVGERHHRPDRGLLSRPTVAEVYAYRRHVDERLAGLLDRLDSAGVAELSPLLELGLHHEQQHQELLLTDIKHVFGINPLQPAYRPDAAPERPSRKPTPLRWTGFDGGIQWIGHAEPAFCYDNELPRHRALVGAFQLAGRPVNNGEFRAFIDDGGYRRAALWLSDGWATVEQERWQAPLYWVQQDGQWWQHTLTGVRPLDEAEPVCHLSYFEADAYARWAEARLPSEFEWEIASRYVPIEGNFVEQERFHPAAADDSSVPRGESPPEQMFGDVWEWTASPHTAYPGYVPAAGALGEYNGKFMCNQFVLRGGSCATPRNHIRRTYRNFFPPAARWQFTGLRLARDA